MAVVQLCCSLLAVSVVVSGLAVEQVTKVPLRSGGSMPIVGLGTWQVTDEKELETALDAALEAGYRHIDTATIYRNEHLIGKVLKRWLQAGKLKREDLFVTTKLPLWSMRASDVPTTLEQSLQSLQLDYVDLWLIHMPFGLIKDAFDSKGKLKPDALDKTTDHISIWKAMEAEVKAGRAKALGVSNFNETQIERLIKHATVQPANLQVELHLHLQQKPLVEFCKKNSISVTAYSPLGSPGNKWLSPSRGHSDLLGLPAVKQIAEHHNKTTAQVLLRHIMQKGIVVIPKSSKPVRIRQNIDIFDFSLDETEMAQLDALDKGIEGKIFDMKGFGGIGAHPEYPWTALL